MVLRDLAPLEYVAFTDHISMKPVLSQNLVEPRYLHCLILSACTGRIAWRRESLCVAVCFHQDSARFPGCALAVPKPGAGPCA